MNHSFIDKYSELGSIVHRLDPRTKIVLLLLYVFVVVLTPPQQIGQFAGYFAVIGVIGLLSGIPVAYVLKRSLVIVPFVFAVSVCAPFMDHGRGGVSSGWIIWNVSVKSWLAAVSMIVLSSTTRFDALLKGMERLAVPPIFIMLLSFMYRYIFVLIDEGMRMQRARDSRSCGAAPRRQVKVMAHIIGALFIRTYERGEQIYKSMVARGFQGEIRTLSFLRYAARDLIFAGLFTGCVVAIKIWI